MGFISAVSSLADAFVQVFVDSARAGCDMRMAANTIESLRDELTQEQDLIKVWDSFDEQIGRADLDRLVPGLLKLRRAFERYLFQTEVKRANKAWSRSPQAGWDVWLTAYLRCYSGKYYRTTLASALATEALPSSPFPAWPPERIAAASACATHGRWAESYDWLVFLGGLEESGAKVRARLLATAAQIQILHFAQPTKARLMLEKAQAFDEADPAIRAGLAEYWKAQDDYDQAVSIYREVTSREPESSSGYAGIAECLQKKGDVAGAETAYGQAILADPGSYSGYAGLLQIYLLPERYERSKPAVEPLLRRALALCDFEPAAYVDLGAAHRDQNRYAEAREAFQKAISMGPAYLTPHTWLGYVDLDEADVVEASKQASLFASAEEHFRAAIAIAPTSHSGYWGMSVLKAAQGDHSAALEWASRCLECHPELESLVASRRGTLLLESGRLEEAETELRKSIAIEDRNQTTLNAVWDLAIEVRKRDNEAHARELLKFWSEHSDAASAHLYPNEVGNWFYEDEDYDKAAALYREAAALKPQSAVVQSNLALASEQIWHRDLNKANLGEAMEALGRAVKLNPEQDYLDRLARLQAERNFLDRFGPRLLASEPLLTAIRMEVTYPALYDLLDDSGNKLGSEADAALKTLRQRILERCGVEVPGIRVADLITEDWGNYFRIWICGQLVDSDYLPDSGRFLPELKNSAANGSADCAPHGRWVAPDEPVRPGQEEWTLLQYLIHRLECVLTQNLDQLIGHDVVARMLESKGSDPCRRMAASGATLTHFVYLLKTKLRQGQSIGDIEALCAAHDGENRSPMQSLQSGTAH